MDVDIAVALIALAGSVTALVWQGFSARKLERFREPLLAAADDLHHRIRAIREHGFLDFLEDPDRSPVALLGTCYRLGKYWGTVEALYGTVDLLQFERSDSTGRVSQLLAEIGRTFATDEYGNGFMVWREEQRAIAELMQRGAEGQRVIGVATFAERYDSFAPWFRSWDQGLRAAGAADHPRLAALQQRLQELVGHLKAHRGGLAGS